MYIYIYIICISDAVVPQPGWSTVNKSLVSPALLN